MYGIVYWVHVACAWLSVAGFLLRGVWMVLDSPLRGTRAARILPHLLDTVLLGAALVLATLSARWPFAVDWLTAKFLALLLYIGLGMVAFRFGRTRRVRMVAFLGAAATAGYILAVAYTRSLLPGFS